MCVCVSEREREREREILPKFDKEINCKMYKDKKIAFHLVNVKTGITKSNI